jgi:DNA-directed RNA polymerase specialized sigma24 family protein
LEGALDGALLTPLGSRTSVRSAVKYILDTTARGLSSSEVPKLIMGPRTKELQGELDTLRLRETANCAARSRTEITRLRASGVSIRAIAAEVSCSVGTVHR